MNKQSVIAAYVRNAFSAGLVVAALGLAGCQGTLHTRWAQASDTYDDLSARIDTLPLDIHSKLDATDLSHIQGVASSSTATAELSGQPRVVLYLGGDQQPTDDTYCQAAPTLHAVRRKPDHTLLAAALCDGPRLVVRMHKELTAKAVTSQNLPWTIQSMRNRLLFGVRVSQAQTPPPTTNG